MKKRIFPESFAFDHPVLSIIPVFSGGVDDVWLSKRAAMFDDFLDKLMPKKGHSYLHLITVGAGERYSANSNGDYFNKSAVEFYIPSPGDGKHMLQLRGGLDEYHDRYFLKNAKVYREHNVGDGQDKGSVVLACMNPKMARGEVVIEVDNDEWADDLHKIASGDHIFFSMG